MQIYYNVTNKYKESNPRFVGAKVIYAPLRIATDSYFPHYLDVVRRLHVSTIVQSVSFEAFLFVEESKV